MDERKVLVNRMSALKDCWPWETWSWGAFMEAIGIDRSSNWEDTVDRVCRLIGGDPEREAAADWVEVNGGLDEVKHNYSFMTEQVAERVGVERKPDEPAHFTIGRIIGKLDKRLMPEGMEWPRFEDGEKVKFGDEFAWGIGKRKCTATKLGSEGFALLDKSIGNSAWHGYSYTERVKRPEPEVLAADGLPIEVGEIVYGGDGEAWEVTGIENGPWSIVGKNGSKQREMKPKWLTHEVPTIYGNDGLPLLPGQKVVNKYSGDTIETVHYDKCPYGHIEKWIRYKSGGWDLAKDVSRVEPKDTKERIAEDEKKHKWDYWGCLDGNCNECPSKIDGKNPRERYGVDNCSDAKIIDLYERLRKLYGRTMGGAE